MSALAGVRVAVTRPAQAADPLAAALGARGARALVIPLVALAGAEDAGPLRAAVARLHEYDWLVFTSAHAVRCFADVRGQAGAGAARLPRIAAVGPTTAAAAAEHLGRAADALPEHATGAALAAAMGRVTPLAGRRVLWPRAQEAREELPADLAAAGAWLDAPVAYRTVPQPQAARQLAGLAAAGEVDVITLTSPSAARCLAAALPRTTGVLIAVIGSTTAAAAAAAGLPVHIVPEVHTIDALVAALEAGAGGSQRDRTT